MRLQISDEAHKKLNDMAKSKDTYAEQIASDIIGGIVRCMEREREQPKRKRGRRGGKKRNGRKNNKVR